MKTPKISLIFLLVSMLALSACAGLQDLLPETGPPEEPAPTLATTSWELVSYGEPGSEIPVIEETEVTLEFQDDSQAVGYGGCNSFGAQYEVRGGALSFTELITTEIACLQEGVMEQEQAYYDALLNAGEFELAEGQLRIWYQDGQRVLNLVQAPD
jgi:heat shock protein HslJ